MGQLSPDGEDPDFGLRCWASPDRAGRPEVITGRDAAALRREAEQRVASGAAALAELCAWSVELNDWVRLEAWRPDGARLG